MSEQDPAAAVEALARAAAELVPPLTERLTRLKLGEIEVRRGDLRVRVAAGDPPAPDEGVEISVARPAVGGPLPRTANQRGLEPVTSPAVGHFVYADGLGPGLTVGPGVEIGFVEMLGVRHEVRSGSSGVVRHLVAESGEPVEYGQLLVEIDQAPG